MTRVLLVDPVSSGAAYVAKLRSRGVEFLVAFTAMPEAFAQQAADLRANTPAMTIVDLADDLEHCMLDPRIVNEKWDYLICAGETGTAAADILRERLAIEPRNAGPTKSRLDKYAAQEALRVAGLRHISSTRVSSEDEGLALKDAVYPMVVKPPNSAGSDGVSVVQDYQALKRVVTELLGSVNALGRKNEHIVVQEFVQGVEYVVDGYVFDGQWRAASVCKYEKDFVNGVPVYRTLSWLERNDIPEAQKLDSYVAGILDALGIRVGCFHAEFFYTANGWVMIEIGLRPHGGGHPTFTEALTGYSQLEMELDCVASHAPPVGATPRLVHRGRVVFFSVEEPVVFNRSPGPQLDAIEGVIHSSSNVQKGQLVSPPRSLFDTFVAGFAVLQAENEQELDERERLARAEFARCYQ